MNFLINEVTMLLELILYSDKNVCPWSITEDSHVLIDPNSWNKVFLQKLTSPEFLLIHPGEEFLSFIKSSLSMALTVLE